MSSAPRPPSHLSRAAKAWWRRVVDEYALSDSDLKLLELAAVAWDRAEEARSALAEHGLTFTDRFGSPKARPEVGVEAQARVGFARLLRELGLEGGPEELDVRLPRRSRGR